MNIYTKEIISLPVIPLRGISMFPHMVVHFDVGREKSILALENATLNDGLIMLTTQIDSKIESPSSDDFYKIGTIARVKQMLRIPGGSIRVLVEGVTRAKILNIVHEEPFYSAEIEEYDYNFSDIKTNSKIKGVMRLVVNSFEEYLKYNDRIASEALVTVIDLEDPGQLADIVAAYILTKIEDCQEILETFDFYKRLEKVHVYLQEEIEVLKIEEKINQRLKKQINKVQKEYYLKEQIRAIQKELGEDVDGYEDAEKYIDKIEELDLPEDVREKILREAKRLEILSSSSPETGVIRAYLDWIISLPWNEEEQTEVDLVTSKTILDEDHYGLKDVKERILEYIAIKKLTDTIKGPILLLLGPPGVGKTSIGKSIARAIDRKYVRMSLGGVRDEAEIRGHRRTYIGAIPGNIMSSIRKAKSKNPVFLLDEIDKIGNDFRGDPASALLEVLDPEQNSTFTDHYLDVPFDLSKVMFVTTANTTQSIPAALLDRMEVIRIGGYTDEEKLQIAKKHLIPKMIKEHGLKPAKLKFSEAAIMKLIDSYTREAGVRNLERQIATTCRKVAKEIVENTIKTRTITINNLEKYLGAPRYIRDKANFLNEIGITNGLAWTAVGGETLTIEVNVMEGTGKVQLTGKLGEVMKESAMAGISFARANQEKYNIEPDFYKKYDIHIHVPEGAIPKDGPSAGITIATAVISALSKTPVRGDIAMTGEITLRGRVLPVGGIKEKVLAAFRLGINNIILPSENKKDLEEIEDEIKENMNFYFVKVMDEVLKISLVKG